MAVEVSKGGLKRQVALVHRGDVSRSRSPRDASDAGGSSPRFLLEPRGCMRFDPRWATLHHQETGGWMLAARAPAPHLRRYVRESSATSRPRPPHAAASIGAGGHRLRLRPAAPAPVMEGLVPARPAARAASSPGWMTAPPSPSTTASPADSRSTSPPMGAHHFFGVPVAESRGASCPSTICSADRHLSARFTKASWDARFDLLDQTFTAAWLAPTPRRPSWSGGLDGIGRSLTWRGSPGGSATAGSTSSRSSTTRWAWRPSGWRGWSASTPWCSTSRAGAPPVGAELAARFGFLE